MESTGVYRKPIYPLSHQVCYQGIGRCLPREMQQIPAHAKPGSSLRTFRLERHLTTESSIRWSIFRAAAGS